MWVFSKIQFAHLPCRQMLLLNAAMQSTAVVQVLFTLRLEHAVKSLFASCPSMHVQTFSWHVLLAMAALQSRGSRHVGSPTFLRLQLARSWAGWYPTVHTHLPSSHSLLAIAMLQSSRLLHVLSPILRSVQLRFWFSTWYPCLHAHWFW